MDERTGQTELQKKDGETEKETTKTEQIWLTFILFLEFQTDTRCGIQDMDYERHEVKGSGKVG